MADLSVAVIVSEKKQKNLKHLLKKGDSWVKYWFPKSMADCVSKKPDLILSKISDFSNVDNSAWVEWLSGECGISQITTPQDQAVITDRWAICEHIDKNSRDRIAIMPQSFLITSPAKKDEKFFPGTYILKTRIACGPPESHLMSIVENPAQLNSYMQDSRIAGCGGGVVAQRLVNHGREFFKVFVIGENVHIYKRPSLDTAKIVRGEIFSPSDVLHAEQQGDETQISKPIWNQLKSMAYRVGDIFNLQLFGIDVIKDAVSGKMFIVDVNYFPNYRELGDKKFRKFLDDFCMDKMGSLDSDSWI